MSRYLIECGPDPHSSRRCFAAVDADVDLRGYVPLARHTLCKYVRLLRARVYNNIDQISPRAPINSDYRRVLVAAGVVIYYLSGQIITRRGLSSGLARPRSH